MFLAGAETQQLFTRDDRRQVGWPTIVGSRLPLALGLLFAPWLVRPSLAGPNGNSILLTIILAVGVAVTSVPVVSEILADLNILHHHRLPRQHGGRLCVSACLFGVFRQGFPLTCLQSLAD